MSSVVNAGPPDVRTLAAAQSDRDVHDYPRSVSSTTADSRLTIVGSLVGSAGLVWLLYTQVLPFSGPIGFLICWYVVYVLMFTAVTAIAHPRPIVVDRLWTAVITGAAVIVAAALVSAVAFVVVRGWAAVHHLNFFTQ